MHNGFLRVAAVAPEVRVGDVGFNLDRIVEAIGLLEQQKVEFALFPEMSLTAYTCGDLFHNTALTDAASDALARLVELSAASPLHFAVGLPVRCGTAMYNCAAILRSGRLDLVAKSYIPNYNEFYERRWWRPLEPGQTVTVRVAGREAVINSSAIFESHGAYVGFEICEDLWVPVPPSSRLALAGAEVIANLSASPDQIGKYGYLRGLVSRQSAGCICGYVYAGAGWGESSTDLVFDGKAMIAENGTMLASNRRWTPADNIAVADIDIEALRRDRMHMTTFADCAVREGAGEIAAVAAPSGKEYAYGPADRLLRRIDPRPFVPADLGDRADRCDEIFNIQAAGLAKRLHAINCKTLVVGISGGLDSTLALLVAVKAFDRLGLPRTGIVGITMPGFGTTSRTHDNAVDLMRELGVTSMEIPIGPAVMRHFEDIGQDPDRHDVTYENSQARERTQILMDVANKLGGIVLGTGDLSELALGWATYNGDHMSMYGVNAGVPKTLVRHLVHHVALEHPEGSETRRLLLDIVDTPISPELLPAAKDGEILQKTEDLVGPYELHDFYLYYMLRYGFAPERIYLLARHAFSPEEYPDETLRKWLDVFMRRFFAQQFKRSCLPDGPKVGSVCLSPRGDWRMPSDASSALWR
ncbi:MAG: NAD(+) synthase [Duncaniella sp.]|nr:NAD(+) synthase [Duncaniella sp.]